MNFYIKQPFSSEICYRLALNFLHKGNIDSSISFCSKALLNDCYNHKAHFLMGEL